MSAVRAMGSGASQATVYTGDQAGYNLAISDLTAAGGIIEVTGLDSLVPGTPPSGVLVLWFRAGGATQTIESLGDFAVPNTRSYRMRDSGGTARTVLTALGTDVLRLAYLASGGLIITDQNGVTKLTLTGTRLSLPSGTDFAPNNLPGSSGQILVSQGAAASPVFQTIVGVGVNVAKSFFVPATAFSTNALATTLNGASGQEWNGWNNFINGSDRITATQMVVPRDFSTLTSWQLYWAQSGTNATNITWVFGHAKMSNGVSANSAITSTNNVVTPPGVANQTVVTTLTDNGVAMVAGDVMKVRLERNGNAGTGGDANPDDMRLIGLLLNYT